MCSLRKYVTNITCILYIQKYEKQRLVKQYIHLEMRFSDIDVVTVLLVCWLKLNSLVDLLLCTMLI